MYRKDSEGWLKHTDFIILDMICLQLAYVLAYAISGYGFNPYETIIYRNMAVFLELADLVMIFAYGTMKSVLKRGYYRDFVVTLNHAIMVGALAVLYLFLLHEGQDFSRLTLMLTIIIYLVMTYVVRELWKKLLRKQMKDGGERKLLIVTSEDVAEQVVLSMQENNYARFSLAGVAVIDADWTGREIHGVPVVANEETAAMYVCQEWIDEVLIVVSEVLPYPSELIEQLSETGVTIHLNLAKITSVPGKKQFVEKVGNYTVLTTSINYASTRQLMLKRLMDIAGGLVGCIFTGIICIFVGPAIYIASPGPIFFAQERVGKNGKKFKMYKFRSMYMDAEERKAELMKDNKLGDGKMFNIFAAFFDGKMEYMQHKKSLWAVRKVLKKYGSNPMGRKAFTELADRRKKLQITQKLWKIMIRTFSLGMKWRWYLLMSVGIKILVSCRVDERLSDTGLRKK
ncbi:sugar transferase [Anaerobutyricum hallii]|nr:sugar transferase [Anaerobutyricum hallii]